MFDWKLPGTKGLTLGDYLFHFLLTVIITYGVIWIIRFFIHQFFKRATFIKDKKTQTIESIYNNTSKYLPFLVMSGSLIQPFFDLKQLIVAGSVFTVIIGFGAQSLMKDIFTGIFLVFEEQFQKGDFVHINGEADGGIVEEIGFRVVKIRMVNGKLMFMPNGEIRKVVNGNIEKRRIFESVIVSFREDPIKIKGLLEGICNELNERHADYLMKDTNGENVEAYRVYGISSLDSTLIGYKFSIAATVKDTSYVNAVQETKELLAQKLFDEQIKMPEQHVFYHNQ